MTLEQSWHRVPGGTAVAALELARALVARGEVDVIGVSARHRAAAGEPWTSPIPIESLPLPRLALYEAWHRLRRPKVQVATGDVNVIHATTIAMPPRSAPLVLTLHDLAWLDNPAHFTRRGLSLFNRGLQLALKDADLVLCSSLATLRACRSVGFEESRLRHVPLGVSIVAASAEEVARVRARHRLEKPYLLWTGTVEPRKNLGRLLRAFATITGELDLVLVGPKGWNESLDGLIAGNRGRVRILGFVPAADLRALYKGARAFCFPSLVEGFGFPVLEAMAQGTPVVTSSGTATEELAEGAGLLVDPRHSSAIAGALQQILDDEGLAAKLSDAGHRRAAEYTWDRTAELVTSAYRSAGS